MPPPPLSRPNRSRCCWRAATCWAWPRPAQAEPTSLALPLLHRLAAAPRPAPKGGARVLVLAPTRELVSQIANGFESFGRHLQPSVTTIFGGVSQFHQVDALKGGVDIIVAAPGRLLDLINQELCDLWQARGAGAG